MEASPTTKEVPVSKSMLRIIWTQSTRQGYRTMSLEENEALESAFARGAANIEISGVQHNLDMSTPTKHCKYQHNGAKSLSRYYCTYYFLTTSVEWTPCHHTVCEQLEASVETGTLTYFDGERDYSVSELHQKNRESQRQRPLLHLRSDGTAVRGDVMGTWGSLDGHTFAAVDYDTCELMERAWRGAVHTTIIKGQPATISTDGTGTLGARPIVRYQCVWHFLNDKGNWESMDPNTDRVLELAFKAEHEELIDGARVYKFNEMVQFNKETNRSRPLMCLLASKGVIAGPTAPAAIVTQHPDITERLKAATLPRTADSLRGAITGTDPVARGLAIINICLNELDCRVKGGILRDVVVCGDMMYNDVDLEGSRTLTKPTWKTTLQGYVSVLETKYGFTGPGDISSRKSKDFFGTGSSFDEGMLIIKFPVMALEMEIVPPWNTLYYPARNVDFSVNNLAVSRSTGAAFGQVVGIGFTPGQIMEQIIERKATPVYDTKWVPFSGQGAMGEGYNRDKWVETYCPTASGRGVAHTSSVPVAERLQMAEHRLKKMRDKGFWLVEQVPPAGYVASGIYVPAPPPVPKTLGGR